MTALNTHMQPCALTHSHGWWAKEFNFPSAVSRGCRGSVKSSFRFIKKKGKSRTNYKAAHAPQGPVSSS